MKSRFFSTIEKKTETIFLTRDEKKILRQDMERMVGDMPVRVLYDIRKKTARTHSSILFLNRNRMFATIAVILALALGGGTGVAAESALPGDALYGVKVHVNEELRAAFAQGDEARAEWDARRAERRLEEAQALIIRGELKTTIQEKLTGRLESHIDKLEEHIAKLQEAGKDEAAAQLSTRLEAALNVHEGLIQDEAENEDETSSEAVNDDTDNDEKEQKQNISTGVLLKVLKERHDKVEGLKEKIEDKVESLSDDGLQRAAQARMEATQKFVESAEALYDKQAEKLTTDQKNKIETQLSAAKSELVLAQESFDAGEYVACFKHIGTAHAAAVRAKVFVRTQVHVSAEGDVRVTPSRPAEVQSALRERLKVDIEDNTVQRSLQDDDGRDSFDATYDENRVDDELERSGDDEFDATYDEIDRPDIRVPLNLRARIQEIIQTN